MKKLLLAAAFAALVVPTSAQAGDVSMRVREVPLGGRALDAAGPATNFNMLGLHWIGSGSVAYRTRTLHGRWRSWRAADADNRSGAWHDGDLAWNGASAPVRFRVTSRVRPLRSYELRSRLEAPAKRPAARPEQPAIVPRAAWR